jgi:hypothetical protein
MSPVAQEGDMMLAALVKNVATACVERSCRYVTNACGLEWKA